MSGFTEDWFSVHACQVLTRLARRTEGLAGDVVEVGCWEGKSTCALANAVHPRIVHAVDTWKGSPGEISETLAAQRDVFSTFVENVQAFTKGNVHTFRCDWRDYFKVHPGPIRFLHIDATHTYDEVRANIEAATDLIVPGGIICGDDNHHQPVLDAAFDVLGTIEIESTLWYWEAPRGNA